MPERDQKDVVRYDNCSEKTNGPGQNGCSKVFDFDDFELALIFHVSDPPGRGTMLACQKKMSSFPKTRCMVHNMRTDKASSLKTQMGRAAQVASGLVMIAHGRELVLS